MKRSLASTLPGLIAALVSGCVPPEPDSPESAAEATRPPSPVAAAPPPAGRTTIFVDAAADTGLDFVHWNGMSGELYYAEMMGSGVALFDYDNDGDLDVYLVQGNALGAEAASGAIFPAPGPLPLRDRLFRNDLAAAPGGARQLRFTDVTEASGLESTGYGMGATAADFDNDGWTDLYVTNLEGNRMFRNRGSGAGGVTFEDVTEASRTGLGGHVGERDDAVRPGALVAPHPVGAEVGDVEIGPAVVVVVAGCHSHAVTVGHQLAVAGDVRESQLSCDLEIVAEEAIGKGLLQDLAWPEHASLNQVDVEVAVVVVVEERAAGAHDLAEVELPRHAVEMDEVETRGRGQVDEDLPGAGRAAGSLASAGEEQRRRESSEGRGARSHGTGNRGRTCPTYLLYRS